MTETIAVTKEHIPIINDWYKAHGMAHVMTQLPQLGYISSHDGEFVAAGFIARVEGNSGIMDSFITDPDKSSIARHECLDEVIEHLIADAEHMGMRAIWAFSVDDGIMKRQERFGFKKMPNPLTVLEL